MFAIRRQTPPPPLSSVNFSRLFVYPIFSISIVFIFSLKNAQNLGLLQPKLEKFLFFEMFLFFLQKKRTQLWKGLHFSLQLCLTIVRQETNTHQPNKGLQLKKEQHMQEPVLGTLHFFIVGVEFTRTNLLEVS